MAKTRSIFGAKHALILIVSLVILIFVGRLILQKKNAHEEVASLAGQNPSSTSLSTTQNTTSTQQRKIQAPSPDISITACADDLRKKTAENKTEYEKNSILVGFKEYVSFEQADNLLSTYGVIVQNKTEAKASYPDRRLITGTVGKGEEFIKICLLKRNDIVRYVDLNKLFSIHE